MPGTAAVVMWSCESGAGVLRATHVRSMGMNAHACLPAGRAEVSSCAHPVRYTAIGGVAGGYSFPPLDAVANAAG